MAETTRTTSAVDPAHAAGTTGAAETMGRRERKKLATRRALAEAAFRLFVERGFDGVSIREVADAADVSTATAFKHFPTKESLVFDEDADQEAALVAAVRDRRPDETVPAALRAHTRHRIERAADPRAAQMQHLVQSTPALADYAHRMWIRHETALAQIVAQESSLAPDDPSCAALAHLALEAAAAGLGQPYWRESIERAFDLLEHGWQALHRPA